MTDHHLESVYNKYLREYRPWNLYADRPAWSYYYRPWLYYPFNKREYSAARQYDKASYTDDDDYYDRYYDRYYDYLYDRYGPRLWRDRALAAGLYDDRTAIEDYLKSMDKMDNLRSSINSLREDLSRSDLHAAEDLYPVDDSVLDAQIWSEGAPRPRLSSSATPYRDQINNLRLKSLRLEEKRLLEVRRLQELERLRGPTPKWYELKTSQFHKEAKKNNEILAAKKQWGSYRDYTESVWKSRDLSRSAPIL